MARRKRDRDDIKIALIATVPWWGWLLLGVVSWGIARAFAGSEIPTKAQFPQVISASLTRVFGVYLSILAPVIFVLLAVISAMARARNKPSGQPRIDPIIRSRSQASAAHAEADQYQWGRTEQTDPMPSIDTASWNIGLLRALEWKRLEQLGALYFRALKFRVEEANFGPDGGVDLRLFAGTNSRPDILVQCKAWNSWKVGVKQVRELRGVMANEGVTEGIFVTTSIFTEDAIAFAKQSNVSTIDGEDLLRKLLNLSAEDQAQILKTITTGDFTTPSCPSCGIKMVKRVPGNGGDPFWGCASFPKCRSKMPFFAQL